jgi:hypothetical protein
MTKLATVKPMAEKRFWELLDWSATRSGSRQRLAALRRELLVLTPEEIVAFHLRLWLVINAAYQHDLLAAATVVNESVSDDGFLYFRCWLVSRGQRAYREALRNADSLIRVVRRGHLHEMEEMLSVAREAWKLRTRRPEVEFDELSKDADTAGPDEMEGEDWDFEDSDEVRRRFPRLAERFLADEVEEDD